MISLTTIYYSPGSTPVENLKMVRTSKENEFAICIAMYKDKSRAGRVLVKANSMMRK